jgi:heme-degrading monooxygenase HmoA
VLEGIIAAMSIVKINAIEVPEGAGPELEKRFAARAGAVESAPGFEGFELLRPTEGETRYFVYTRWASQEAFDAWRAGDGQAAHAGQRSGPPVSSGASLLGFEVVTRVEPAA